MEYENTILKFKNKDCIKKLLDKYNFWNNRILKKERVFINVIKIGLGGSLVSGILGATLSNEFFMRVFMSSVPIAIFSLLIFGLELINKNENRQLEILNDKFVEAVRSNPSIFQDLSTLVVDESSKDTFIYLTNIVLSEEEFPRALEKLNDILEYSPDPLYTFSNAEKRNKLMKNLNIDLNIYLNIEEDVTVKNKVTDKQATKQKLLGML